jgi:hypothetical protein
MERGAKHNLVQTYEFARAPDPDELQLSRVLREWKRILERCPDTLAATDQKDALKWRASPKQEAASQRTATECHDYRAVQRGVGALDLLHAADGTGRALGRRNR